MGFERLVRTLQGKTSNYDTDVFQPILKAIAEMAGTTYGQKDNQKDIAMRVIADHIRTIALLPITDGQLPSNASGRCNPPYPPPCRPLRIYFPGTETSIHVQAAACID